MSDDAVLPPSMSELRMRSVMEEECPVCYSATGTTAIEFKEEIDRLKAQIITLTTENQALERDIESLRDQALRDQARIHYLTNG